MNDCQHGFVGVTPPRSHQNCHKKELHCTYPECHRKFVWQHHLNYHLQTHKGEKPFKCDLENCNKAFVSAQQRDVHKRIHTGMKPFTCDVCKKNFTTQQNRDSHYRTHTGSKPFKCDFAGCTKSFAESSSLKKHVLVHTGDKPHKCTHCNKRFTQISTLRGHERRYHIENAMPTRSIANIQAAQQRAAAEAAAEELKQKHIQVAGELSAPSSFVYQGTPSPFISDSIISITCLNGPLEGEQNLSSSLLHIQGKCETEMNTSEHQLVMDSNAQNFYEETYSSVDQRDLIVYSDEQCVVGFKEDGDQVIIEQNEGVGDRDYGIFQILEETVVRSEDDRVETELQ